MKDQSCVIIDIGDYDGKSREEKKQRNPLREDIFLMRMEKTEQRLNKYYEQEMSCLKEIFDTSERIENSFKENEKIFTDLQESVKTLLTIRDELRLAASLNKGGTDAKPGGRYIDTDGTDTEITEKIKQAENAGLSAQDNSAQKKQSDYTGLALDIAGLINTPEMKTAVSAVKATLKLVQIIREHIEEQNRQLKELGTLIQTKLLVHQTGRQQMEAINETIETYKTKGNEYEKAAAGKALHEAYPNIVTQSDLLKGISEEKLTIIKNKAKADYEAGKLDYKVTAKNTSENMPKLESKLDYLRGTYQDMSLYMLLNDITGAIAEKRTNGEEPTQREISIVARQVEKVLKQYSPDGKLGGNIGDIMSAEDISIEDKNMALVEHALDRSMYVRNDPGFYAEDFPKLRTELEKNEESYRKIYQQFLDASLLGYENKLKAHGLEGRDFNELTDMEEMKSYSPEQMELVGKIIEDAKEQTKSMNDASVTYLKEDIDYKSNIIERNNSEDVRQNLEEVVGRHGGQLQEAGIEGGDFDKLTDISARDEYTREQLELLKELLDEGKKKIEDMDDEALNFTVSKLEGKIAAVDELLSFTPETGTVDIPEPWDYGNMWQTDGYQPETVALGNSETLSEVRQTVDVIFTALQEVQTTGQSMSEGILNIEEGVKEILEFGQLSEALNEVKQAADNIITILQETYTTGQSMSEGISNIEDGVKEILEFVQLSEALNEVKQAADNIITILQETYTTGQSMSEGISNIEDGVKEILEFKPLSELIAIVEKNSGYLEAITSDMGTLLERSEAADGILENLGNTPLAADGGSVPEETDALVGIYGLEEKEEAAAMEIFNSWSGKIGQSTDATSSYGAFKSILNSAASPMTNDKQVRTALEDGEKRYDEVKAVVDGTKGAMSLLVPGIGMAVGGISILLMAIDYFKERAEKHTEMLIKLGEGYETAVMNSENIKNIIDLVAEHKDSYQKAVNIRDSLSTSDPRRQEADEKVNKEIAFFIKHFPEIVGNNALKKGKITSTAFNQIDEKLDLKKLIADIDLEVKSDDIIDNIPEIAKDLEKKTKSQIGLQGELSTLKRDYEILYLGKDAEELYLRRYIPSKSEPALLDEEKSDFTEAVFELYPERREQFNNYDPDKLFDLLLGAVIENASYYENYREDDVKELAKVTQDVDGLKSSARSAFDAAAAKVNAKYIKTYEGKPLEEWTDMSLYDADDIIDLQNVYNATNSLLKETKELKPEDAGPLMQEILENRKEALRLLIAHEKGKDDTTFYDQYIKDYDALKKLLPDMSALPMALRQGVPSSFAKLFNIEPLGDLQGKDEEISFMKASPVTQGLQEQTKTVIGTHYTPGGTVAMSYTQTETPTKEENELYNLINLTTGDFNLTVTERERSSLGLSKIWMSGGTEGETGGSYAGGQIQTVEKGDTNIPVNISNITINAEGSQKDAERAVLTNLDKIAAQITKQLSSGIKESYQNTTVKVV